MLSGGDEVQEVPRLPLGPAAGLWNDFVGSAAADQSSTGTSQSSLYELAGLDPDGWLILGVDLVLHGSTEHARVYALDKTAQRVTGQDDLLELAYENGELVVDAFEVDPAAVGTFRSLFANVSVRLIARGVSDQRLVVRSRP